MTIKTETLNAQVRITLDFTAWLMMYLQARRWTQHQVARLVAAYMTVVGAVVAGISYVRSSPSLFAAWVLREKSLALAYIHTQSLALKTAYMARREACRAALVAAIAGRELMELRAQIAALENMIQAIPKTQTRVRAKATSRREAMQAELNGNTLSIDAQELTRAVDTVARTVCRKSHLPILQGILISSQESSIRLCGTDLETSIATEIPCRVQGGLAAVLQAKELQAALKKLTGRLTITQEPKACVITDGTTSVSLYTVPAEEFPAVPTVENAREYSFPSLAENLSNVMFCCAPSTKPFRAITGVCFNGGELAATDTFRLAVLKTAVEIEKPFIVPALACATIARLFKDQPVTVQVGDAMASFQAGNTVVYSRLLDAQYPNYGRAIPSSFAAKFAVDAKTLLDRMPAPSRDEFGTVTLDATQDSLIITTQNPESSATETRYDISLEGEPCKVAVRHHYLTAALKACQNPTIAMRKDNGPITIIDGDLLYLIMPVTKNE